MEREQDTYSPIKRKADESAPDSAGPEVSTSPNHSRHPQLTHHVLQAKRLKPGEAGANLTPGQPQGQQPTPQETPRRPTQSEHHQPAETASGRRQALEAEYDALGHHLGQRRELFSQNGALFADLDRLYQEVSEITQRTSQRTGMNNWVEELSIELLEVLRRMEEVEAEIFALMNRRRVIFEALRDEID